MGDKNMLEKARLAGRGLSESVQEHLDAFLSACVACRKAQIARSERVAVYRRGG
ncbi:hypothetical protein Psfp_01162 [Pelotomaculum sp. FP]|nr:hypothetical protein Psfp_01162 [Pelotomaculum sp. FP]